ncbi:NAD kinase [Actinophytocola sp. NPDC049390]|uniref:NAD kinase n=1 Tax=Actinophytocola sp. NPDC049390 TaxID=3363894 RepID=UPI00378E356B
MTAREVLLVVHTGRLDTRRAAEKLAGWFADAGITVRVLEREAPDLDAACYQRVVPVSAKAAEGTELVFVLGGDGTLLRAAELARPAGVPVLAVNMGRVGFLAEADSDVLEEAVSQVIAQRYEVVDRMTVDVTASLGDRVLAKTWALNEASVEKSSRERILDVRIEVDNRPVSSFGCDGVLCATPTGSTAYAFSAGGPVVWPDVQALLVVPSNAHAMFARPLVVSPDSRIAVEVDPSGHPAVLCCDGRRTFVLPPGARVEVVGGEIPARLVKLRQGPFTDRLVEKFELPVQGWRSPRG